MIRRYHLIKVFIAVIISLLISTTLKENQPKSIQPIQTAPNTTHPSTTSTTTHVLRHAAQNGVQIRFHPQVYQKSSDLIATLAPTPKSECELQKNIFFLKTHKTGSSTIQNILLRYGEKYNLTFALPKSTTAHVYNYNVKFSKWMVRDTVNRPNILLNHLHFDSGGVREFMPDDTLFISIVRDVDTLFESIFDYYLNDANAFVRVKEKFPELQKDKFLLMQEFLNNPLEFVHPTNTTHYEHLARNSLSYDFGIDDLITRKYEISSLYKTVLEQTLGNFHLIMNMNHFDESLVLLKDLLCCPYEDLVYLRINSRATFRHEIPPSLSKQIEKWNDLDKELYSQANETFWKRIDNFGHARMATELQKLELARQKVTEDCVAGTEISYSSTGSKIISYRLAPNAKDVALCQKLLTDERKYLYIIAYRQQNEFKNKNETLS